VRAHNRPAPERGGGICDSIARDGVLNAWYRAQHTSALIGKGIGLFARELKSQKATVPR
jgi:hypothetical protein